MCLTVNKRFNTKKEIAEFMKNPTIATKNITVYKMLERGRFDNLIYSPYKNTEYKPGELKTAKRFTPGELRFTTEINYYIGYYLNIEAGIHSYTDKNTAIKENIFGRCFIVRCTIPKGTPYIIGTNNEIVSLALQMPKKLIPIK